MHPFNVDVLLDVFPLLLIVHGTICNQLLGFLVTVNNVHPLHIALYN